MLLYTLDNLSVLMHDDSHLFVIFCDLLLYSQL